MRGDIVGCEGLEPPRHRAGAASTQVTGGVAPDQGRHAVDVALRAGVVEGGVDVAVLFPPRARARVQGRLDRRVEAIELATEHVPEEVVVAVPLTASVERDEEQVRSVDLLEHSRRVRALQDVVTYPRRQAIEHRGPNQELAELSGKRPESRVAAGER